MSEIKRRQPPPAAAEGDGAKEEKKVRRKKTDDYQSSDGPNGPVVFKRGGPTSSGGYKTPSKGGPSGSKERRGYPRTRETDDHPDQERPLRERSDRDAGLSRPKRTTIGERSYPAHSDRPDNFERSERPARPPRRSKPDGDKRPSRWNKNEGDGDKRPSRWNKNEGDGDNRSSRWNKNETGGDKRPSRWNKTEGDRSRPPRWNKTEGDRSRPERSDHDDRFRKSAGTGERKYGSHSKPDWKSSGSPAKTRFSKPGFDRDKFQKPSQSALKASQSAALVAAADREIPTALKRLSEAENQLLKSAEQILKLGSSFQDVLDKLATFDQQAEPAADVVRTFKELLDSASKVANELSPLASFHDLVGQRLIKVSDFLEDLKAVLEEILEEQPQRKVRREEAIAPKKPKAKSARPTITSSPIKDDDDDNEGEPEKSDGTQDHDDFESIDNFEDDDDTSEPKVRKKANKDEEKALKKTKMANTFKTAKNMEKKSLFGPDAAVDNQTEIDQLVDRLFDSPKLKVVDDQTEE
ncbi:MAG: hypothetical protein LBT47_07720 [Deltaproteobacteria bacterium]|jgi:hypothetical protein|nr:hypothetical protein [Deltaproteobacteria bacterium]